MFWVGVMIIGMSPFLVFIPVFGFIFITVWIVFGFILAVLGNIIWKEDVRRGGSLYKMGPAALAASNMNDKKKIHIGMCFIFSGPILCYILLFQIIPSSLSACYFPIILASIAMFPMGMALVFFGISSMERNALLKYNIPEQHFLWVERERIRRKTIEIAFCLIFIYLILFLTFIAPTIIEYNEFWEDGHSGARSPFGSGGECCSIILIILFIVIFVMLRTTLLFKLKRDYLKRFEEFHKIR